MVEVERKGERGDVVTVSVRVREGSSETAHEVTVRAGDLARLGRPSETAESFVGRCFEFLLEREPKESILRTFDVTVIGRYFPEWERTIGRPRTT
jgi:hypothetical protein